jgi:hypothetical protein
MDETMTRRDREELAKLVRRRERVAKSATAQRSGELLADFEQKLGSVYDFDDDAVWREAYSAAEAEVERADAAVARRCDELGIPARFRPSLFFSWSGRGENAVAQRRAELRHVARARIAASEKAAKAEIERRSVELQTQLVAGGLESAEARRFLDTMPTPEALMPPLSVKEIEGVAASPGRARSR